MTALISDSTPAQTSDVGCPQTSPTTSYGTGTLDTLVEEKSGVQYIEENGEGKLTLSHAGGSFKSTTLGITDLTVYASVGDFDSDGYDDFVGGDLAGHTSIYQNYSGFWLPSPDSWDDPDFVLDSDFWPTTYLGQDPNGNYYMLLTAGDFNGDGHIDVFRANSEHMGWPQDAYIWLNTGTLDFSGYPVFNAPYDAMALGTFAADLGQTAWAGTNIAVVDYNKDRKLDLLVGSAETDGGSIRIFLNTCTSVASPPPPPALIPCADAPKFSYAGPLIENMQLGGNGSGELPVFAYEDFDGDGLRDLIAGSPLCCSDSTKRLQMWRGVSGGGIESTPSQSISFVGAATAVLAADFSLDGLPDLVVATDGNHYGSSSNIGGKSFYYVNNGSNSPFSFGYEKQLTDYGAPTTDFDVGFVFNYDNDPDSTPDLMIADGNDSSSYLLFANRTLDQYVDCGIAASGILDLGPLEDSELVINSARLTPTVELNGGTISWYMSNEDPPNWVAAVDCGDGSGDVCATFPKPVGRKVRWKAVMCSNFDQTQTPSISGVDIKFDYTEAKQYLRSGVVISDGVTYMGTFSQPGDRGRFYAINAGLDTTYWEFGENLDAMNDSDRNIYTTTTDGAERLMFDWTADSDMNSKLVTTLGASDGAQAQEIIDWVRSPRFGVGQAIPPTRLGGVERSTPAVLNKPGMPIWYTMAGSDDRAAVDQFISEYSDRIPLVLFGSKDGMVHAVRSDPTSADFSASPNGTEAWAFIPGKVASRMLTDYTNSLGGELNVSAYPDGAPTLADVRINGVLRTVAVIGSGNGGKSFAAIDVTETVDPDTDAVLGPEPLWHATPGGADAGQSYAKPVLARVNIDDTERFIVIAGTGLAFDNVSPPYTKGRMVVAYDVADGSPLWKFQTVCPITSHIAVFETDDENDAIGAIDDPRPQIDGFMDRVVFADRCGYVYKLNPAKDENGGWNFNEGYGSIETAQIDGESLYALFSTTHPDALGSGQQRPIAGTIGVRVDKSSRVVLYFGTGGLEEYDPTLTNEFYAVYADTGELRSKLTGACDSGTGLCEKFYGGVVVTTEQVIYTRSRDRQVGTGICDQGTTYLDALQINANADGDFVSAFDAPVQLSSATVGTMYGDADAVYIATMAGDVVRVGSPRAINAGDDTANGNTGGLGGGNAGETGTNEPLILMGWRQIF